MANLLRTGDRIQTSVPSNSSTRIVPTITDFHNSKKSDKTAFDTWNVAQIWIQSVSKEQSTRKQWEHMYGWMADYDPKGNLKPRKAPVENSSRFSNTVPNSRGHDYGWRLQSNLGQEINHLQTSLNNQHRKHRSKEMLGSD